MLKRRVKTVKSSGWRMQFLLTAVFLFFIIIFLRLCELQIIKHGFYSAMAQGQHELYEKIVPQRGTIYINDVASNGLYPVAVNKEMNLVYAVPRNIKAEDKMDVAKKISEKLQLDYAEVLNKLSKPDDAYEVLKKR